MSKRVYVHFLGYSEAEGGIQEIITNNTFNLGSIDLETGEREFDEIEFDVPLIDILKIKPVSDNTAGTLKNSLICLQGQGEDYTYTNITIEDMELQQDDLIWVENERMKSVNPFVDYVSYSLQRGINGSIPVTHISEEVEKETDCITVTKKRLSPIGLFVKMFTSEKVLAYGQLTSVTKKNTGLVTCKCKNLCDVDSVIYLRGDLVRDWNNGYINCSALRYYTVNEFFAKFEIPSVLMDYKIKFEQVEGNPYWYKIENVKDYVNQIMTINSSFIKFSNGFYGLGSFKRGVQDEAIRTGLLSQNVIAGGTVDFEISNPYSAVEIDSNLSDEPYTIWVNDSNFKRAYTATKKISLDLSAMVLHEDEVQSYDNLVKIAMAKLFMLNNTVEFMTITAPKRGDIFEIGNYYRFLDIGKYKSFYDSVEDNVFFCYSVDEGVVKFARTLFFQTKMVAPSVMVKKTGTYTYEVQDVENLKDYVYANNYISGISGLTNEITGTTMFEEGDKVTLINANRTVQTSQISNIVSNTITLNSSLTGSNGDLFIFTIESMNPSVKDKNQVYFYDNNEGVL